MLLVVKLLELIAALLELSSALELASSLELEKALESLCSSLLLEGTLLVDTVDELMTELLSKLFNELLLNELELMLNALLTEAPWLDVLLEALEGFELRLDASIITILLVELFVEPWLMLLKMIPILLSVLLLALSLLALLMGTSLDVIVELILRELLTSELLS